MLHERLLRSTGRGLRSLLHGLALVGVLCAGTTHAAVITPGTPTDQVPDYLSLSLGQNQFLLPVEVTGAIGLQVWGFDLTFDPDVVQVVDPGDGSSGIYGAKFDADSDATLASILAGFPFNEQGRVEGVAGFYTWLLDGGVTGNGILAWILFETIVDQEDEDPGFNIPTAPPPSVPEPGTLALLVPALALVAAARRRNARHRADN
jgi:hypothetical protein